jgi:3-oxoacyl-[acyl-carrier-protein] synthase-3
MQNLTPTRGAVITGWGTALPNKVVTNDDLAATLDTSDEWISERTGIRERRIGGTTSGLAVEAGQLALQRAGVDPSEIDLILLATTTPDDQVPATSSKVQYELGLTCGAMDINAACSGFVYGLVTAHGFIANGCDKILLIGAETLSRITDWNDRSTAILFADGAGAVVLESVDGPGQLLGWNLASMGGLRHILHAEIGGHLKMEGREVFRQAVVAMCESAEAALENAGVHASDVSLVVPHQANIRIIDAAMKRLGIPRSRAAEVIHRTGNTSSASIPLTLVDAIDRGRISDDDILLLVGFGAGMTSASAVIRWGGHRQ